MQVNYTKCSELIRSAGAKPLMLLVPTLLVVAVFSIPFPTVISPAIKITVVDQAGGPVQDVDVRRKYYSIWKSGEDRATKSTAVGQYDLSEHVEYLSLMHRIYVATNALNPFWGHHGWQPTLSDIHMNIGKLQYNCTSSMNGEPNPFFYSNPGKVVLRVQNTNSNVVSYEITVNRQ